MDASDQPEHNLEETQITAPCWASSNGAVLAVGYIDRDIMFWKTSTTASSKGRKAGASSNNVVRLSAARKLPVIVLHWSANSKSQNDCDGQLFVYGGDEIGSEEVLTVSSANLLKNGSFGVVFFLKRVHVFAGFDS